MSSPALPLLLLLAPLLALVSPLDKFPHPYVSHPRDPLEPRPPAHHSAVHSEGGAHVPPHLPAPAPPPGPADPHAEHAPPRKCHTEYVSVISKVLNTFKYFAKMK